MYKKGANFSRRGGYSWWGTRFRKKRISRPWEGYNFEDAVLISERLVCEDIYTSFHIRKYEIQTHVTSQGPERITKEIPGSFTPKFRQKWNCNAGILVRNRRYFNR